MVLQDAARYTSHCQCRSGVDMSEPQAKVKQVHHAPLRWQQLTQFLLRGGKEVEKPELKLTHRKHSVLFMDVLSCRVVFCMYTVSTCILVTLPTTYKVKPSNKWQKVRKWPVTKIKCGSTCQKIGRARKGTALHPTSGKICH